MMPSYQFRPRFLNAEILDSLPVDHPAARASRRDLRLFNHALGNTRWIASTITRRIRTGERILELGSGLGEMARRMTARSLKWDGLDRVPQPAAWPPDARWHQVDVRAFDHWRDYGVVTANLFFHHFDDDTLSQLGAKIARHARLIVIGDLRRSRLQQWLFSGFAHLVRAHRVSHHDGGLSIRAGFRGNELSDLLGLHRDHWKLTTTSSVSGAYRLVAERRS